MAGTLFPYGLRIPTPAYAASLLQGAPNDAQRAHAAQLYDLSTRIRLGLPYPPNTGLSHPAAAVGMRPFDPLHYLYSQQDPRARFFHEEPKPSYSYIGLIAMAILSSKEKKLILSDIYQWVIDNYPYFRTRGTGWRNSIRHNLSLNDCFIKAGRAANGKGHYWAVHAAVVEDFERGDFRRRRAQRKVRKAMGLAVPDEEESPSPPPPSAETIEWRKRVMALNNSNNSADDTRNTSSTSPPAPAPSGGHSGPPAPMFLNPCFTSTPRPPAHTARKRGFDVASLLAPDDDATDVDAKQARLEPDAADDSDVDVDDSSAPVSSPHSSPVNITPWSRPSAFHPLSPPSWRPFLPAGFPLLRAGPPPPPPLPLPSPPSPNPDSPCEAEEKEGEEHEDHRDAKQEEGEDSDVIPV